ncbi:response regulator [Candidatus Saccharibacteria bacterium]|nr:response regulator [Candidatus Saccharibacteria bacterium]
MTKIMVVEDDQSLREIYSIRLTAEGYEVVSAGDGEEALAIAVKEKPDLILSDVMMPKISGFDMLDILRSTPETKTIKVIMMTALSSDDQRKRGEGLGADKYLVKSQVGIEDVIAAIKEVLGGAPSPSLQQQAMADAPAAALQAAGIPVQPTPVAPTPVQAAPAPQVVQASVPVAPTVPAQPVSQPVVAAPIATAPEAPEQPAPQPVAPTTPQGDVNAQPVQQPAQSVPPVAPAQ